jgi:serine/threonine-protein kinase
MSDGQATATKSGVPDPLIGRVIADRFRITSLIARGGMGKVYRAEQAPLGRLCALKILNPNYNGDADPEFHRRFFREASIASKITHPNSVTIFDYGKTDDEIYYMAMEYLEGQTLHQALRAQGTIREERAGRIAVQICRALREAHSLGVIHRDLKPANIFLSRHDDDEDFVKVLDFGLVKHISERPEEQLTQTGLFMGSPKYMAPEQIQGGHVDARTDVYSLGIIMYEMLAGKVPFDRPTSVNILMAHVGEPPPPMREVNPNLVCSPAFEELVMRCIAKDPAERFASMDEVLQAIKRAHNVSMTGQLAAMNASGAYAQLTSAPPPAVISSQPSGPGAPVLASGSHTPIGILRADSTAMPSALPVDEVPPRRSRAWIGVGVLVAAVLGGVLGMTAFRLTSSAPISTSEPAPAPSPSASDTAAHAVEQATSAAAAPVERIATVHFSSDPPGAAVHEEGVELCASTPCDVTFKGEAADPAKVHKVTFSKAGFRAETKPVKPTDPQAHVKLWLAQNSVRPAVRPSQPAAKPTNDPATPSGFKDLPY